MQIASAGVEVSRGCGTVGQGGEADTDGLALGAALVSPIASSRS